MMTANHLTPEQIPQGGPLLSGSGWGFGMAVTVEPDDLSPAPGRYGWAGGYSTVWFNDPHLERIAIALTQTVGFLFNGGLADFEKLAANVHFSDRDPNHHRA
jgi:CubicO group peptidase (beta-lactamase class C family)